VEKIFIKIIFFLIVSYISAEFYATATESSKRSKKYLFVFIMLSHAGIILPVYSIYESFFDVLQIVLELIIIFVFTDGKVMKKIYAYLWFNVFCMIGMAVGYVIYMLAGNTLKTGTDILSVVIYYGVYLVIVEVACLIFIGVDKKRQQQMYSIGGVELSVIMGTSTLLIIYAVGRGVFSSEGYMRHSVIYGLLIYVLLAIGFVWVFNRKIYERDSRLVKKYVEETYCKNTDIFERQLSEKEKLYGEKISRMKSELGAIYESMGDRSKIIESMLCEKKRLAEEKCINVKIISEIENEVAMATEDIVCVMGNLMDNAIRAAGNAKLSCDNSQYSVFNCAGNEIMDDCDIFLKMYAGKDGIKLTLENIYDGNLRKEDDRLKTTKTESGEHGLGVENVRRTLAKYGKEMTIEADDKVFRVIVK